jgi:hypothetical protein
MYIIYIVFSRSVSRMMWRMVGMVMEKQVEAVIADLCIFEMGKSAPDL